MMNFYVLNRDELLMKNDEFLLNNVDFTDTEVTLDYHLDGNPFDMVAISIKNDEFCIKTMNCVLKMMNFVQEYDKDSTMLGRVAIWPRVRSRPG